VYSVIKARSIGFPWAVEPAVDPLTVDAALADPLTVDAALADPAAVPVAEFDEHAVSISAAAAASPQTPPRRGPCFMGSPVVGRCQTTSVDPSLLIPTVARTMGVTAVTVWWEGH
jgi:hypothetical protein